MWPDSQHTVRKFNMIEDGIGYRVYNINLKQGEGPHTEYNDDLC